VDDGNLFGGCIVSERETPFWIDRSDRERILVTGSDRAKFLHNLCTNDIKKLAVSRGCEAFVTSPQGKTIGFLTLLATEDSMLLRADPASLDLVLPHFAKYSVFDDVNLEDEREKTLEIHIAGDAASAWLAEHNLPSPEDRELAHLVSYWGETPIRIVRESPFGGEGFTLIADESLRSKLVSSFQSGQIVFARLSNEEAESLRIEAGTPRFGLDITPDNLPQELGRDNQAISFVKGCYLGQETVARIDALGHVNKVLRGIAISSDNPPSIGTELFAEGKPAGTVTSSAYSALNERSVALAMTRIKVAQVGQQVTWNGGEGVVTNLPIP
jgi:folate-binding protein YgfZ